MRILSFFRNRFWLTLVLVSVPAMSLTVLAMLFLMRPSGPQLPKQEDLAGLSLVFGTDQPPAPAYDDFTSTSQYLDMRDGTRIAVDLYLPTPLGKGERVPVVLTATRYWRRWEMEPPVSWLYSGTKFIRLFTAHGFAVAQIDARGSGASFGARPHPWSDEEVADYAEIIDWAAEQPWSNGNVGATGISYEGTCAEFMAYLDRPALKAAAVRFSLFDVFEDIAWPGGVFNQWFVEKWGEFNEKLDAGKAPDALPSMVGMLVLGPAPVDGSGRRKLLMQALDAHAANVNVFASSQGVDFRDQPSLLSGAAADDFSPHSMLQQQKLAGRRHWPALYSWGGWYDGAYADAALKRMAAYPGPHTVVIGPWNHAGVKHISQFLPQKTGPEPTVLAQQLDLVRFFNHYLKGLGPKPENRLRFNMMGLPGNSEWLNADSWPPRGGRKLEWFLGPEEQLLQTPSTASPPVDYAVDFTAGSGHRNRWRTQLGRSDVVYGPMPQQKAPRLVFISEPLEEDLRLAGRPELTLRMSVSRPDGAVHAYLYALSPNKEKFYLTEGLVRLIHGPGPERSFRQKDADPPTPGEPFTLRFSLLSTAVRLPAGYSLRLVLAGADADQFARYPAEGEQEWRVYVDGGSSLHIPSL